MVGSLHYPKRAITVEPFGNQIDVIEKTLVEIENQPPRQYTYINQNRQRHQSNIPFKPTTPVQHHQVTSSAANIFLDGPADVSHGAYPDAFQTVQSHPPISTQIPAKPHPSPKTSVNLVIHTTFDPFQPTDFKNDSRFSTGLLSGYLSGSLSSTATSSNIWGNNDNYRSLKDAAVWG